MLDENVKKDLLGVLCMAEEDLPKLMEDLIANRLEVLNDDTKRKKNKSRFTTMDSAWLARKTTYINRFGVTRLHELLNELYNQGYKIVGINQDGFAHGMLYIRTEDKFGNKCFGYVDLAGNLTLSVKHNGNFVAVLRLLYGGNKISVRDTALEAVMTVGGLTKKKKKGA